MLDVTEPGPQPGAADMAAARYGARRGELGALCAQLREGHSPEERAILTATLLTAAGDLLRRSRRVTYDESEVDAALSVLSRDDVSAWASRLKIESVKRATSRAVDDAFEVALSDSEDERSTLLSRALEGLSLRDGLESALSAVARWQQSVRPLDARLADRLIALRASVATIDTELARGARALVCLNDVRRAESALLDSAESARAWWYTARNECDGLVGLFVGQSVRLTHCEHCARDTAHAAPVESPPRKHLSADDLWRYELGLLDARQTTSLKSHAAQCASCRDALRALSEGERAIEETINERPSRLDAATPDEAVLDHPRLRAALTRRGKRPMVVVTLKDRVKVRQASLHVEGATPVQLPARRTAQGLEFNLVSLRKTAGLRVKLRLELDDESKLELDWSL